MTTLSKARHPEDAGAPVPTVPAMRVLLHVASGLVLTIGMSLYALSERTEEFFAWTIGVPLTAAFLGGGYLTSCLLELMAARRRVWAEARIAVPAVFVFTSLTLVVTIVHIDAFHFDVPRWYTVLGTWIWLLVYAIVPVWMAVVTALQMRTPGADPPRSQPLPTPVRATLFAQGAVMAVSGIALLVAPSQTASLWAWDLTPLTARAVGAWLVGLGIAAVHAGFENDRIRIRPVVKGYVVFPLLQALALLRYPDAAGLDWSSPAALAYVVFLGWLGATGAWVLKGIPHSGSAETL